MKLSKRSKYKIHENQDIGMLWFDIMNKKPILYRHKVYTYGWYQNWRLKFIQIGISNDWIKRVKEE